MRAIIRSLIVLCAAVNGAVACDTQSDVLSSTSEAQLQKADGTWETWCARGTPFEMRLFLDEAKQGLACTQVDEEQSCGGVLDVYGCGWDIRNCINGRVQATTTNAIGCPAATAETSNTWTDCGAALATANTGDACSWLGQCTRVTDDPCCIEVAACSVIGSDRAVVQRNRICAPDCTSISADTSHPRVSSCVDAAAALGHYGASCSQGLVCSLAGPSTLIDAMDPSATTGMALYFCADGKFMFTPQPFATAVF